MNVVQPDSANPIFIKNSSEPAPPLLPGARATAVHGSTLWNQFFETLGRAKTPLSSFWHSLRIASPGAQSGPKGRVWPMPMPFPSLHRRSARRQQPDVCRKLALNATILVLSWLYLGRPSAVHEDCNLGLGTPLTLEQWQVVRTLGRGITAWNEQPIIGPEAMGRSAAKVESCELILTELRKGSRLESPGPWISARVCGKLDLEPATLAQPVVADRLRFVGTPSFEASPFLDSHSRAVFERPLDFARHVPDEERVPFTQVRCGRPAAIKLLELLDGCDRLSLMPSAQVRLRLLNGLFTVPKSLDRDRMVLDARAANQAEQPQQPWIRSLASLEQLQWLHLDEHENLTASTDDLREYYHAFAVSPQRAARNALAIRLSPREVAHLRCFTADLWKHPSLHPCLKTMAMGDCSAVGFGQCAHLSVLLRSKAVTLEQFVPLSGRPPRSGLVAGLLIDDFALLEKVHAQGPRSDHEAPAVLSKVHKAYEDAGLPRHPEKSVSQALRAEFWGGAFDGAEGTIRPNHKRTIPLASLLLRTVDGGLLTPELAEIYAGSLVSAFQLRRRLMSLLDRVYSEARGLPPRSIFRMSPTLRAELLVCAVLLPQSAIDFRTPGAPILVASDASSRSEAAVCLDVRREVSVECCRHGLQRGLWNRLLKPLGALQRERGELPDEEQLPGACYSSHPLWEACCRTQQFRPFGRIKHVKRRRHINLGSSAQLSRPSAGSGLLGPRVGTCIFRTARFL